MVASGLNLVSLFKFKYDNSNAIVEFGWLNFLNKCKIATNDWVTRIACGHFYKKLHTSFLYDKFIIVYFKISFSYRFICTICFNVIKLKLF